MMKLIRALSVMVLAVLPLSELNLHNTSSLLDDEGQSREMPLAFGETGLIGDYALRVLATDPDATDDVLGENMFNEPPEPGNVFFMVRVEATYLGDDTGKPGPDLRFSIVGDQNRGYSEYQADCGVVPDSRYQAPELFNEGSAEFNACWSVPTEEVGSFVMYVETGSSSDRIWFALDVDTGGATGMRGDGLSKSPASAIALEVTELTYSEDEINADSGDTIELTNTGILEHSFVVDELDIHAVAQPNGDTVSITIPEHAEPGVYEFYCSFPGHKEAGIVGTLTIGEDDDSESVGAATPTLATPAATPTLATPAATPQPNQLATPITEASQVGGSEFFSGATRTVGSEVERYVWPQNSDDFHGFGLSPISLTVGNYDGAVFLTAEFVNSSAQPILVPRLVFTASLDGASFGDANATSFQYVAAPGDSVFFEGRSMYGGSILYGDWNGFDVTFTPGVDWGDEYDTLDVRIDFSEGKIYNDGDTPKENISLVGVGRDGEGVYVGTCVWQPLGAAIPAGLFVRLPEGISKAGSLSRSCGGATVGFAQALGTDPVKIDHWFAMVPKP